MSNGILEDDGNALGMERPIDRRDFLNGVAIAIGALGVGPGVRAAAAESYPQDQAGYYPPALTGLTTFATGRSGRRVPASRRPEKPMI